MDFTSGSSYSGGDCAADDSFAAEKDGGEEKLTKVTLNEVAHSIFYAPQYVAIEEGYFFGRRSGSDIDNWIRCG